MFCKDALLFLEASPLHVLTSTLSEVLVSPWAGRVLGPLAFALTLSLPLTAVFTQGFELVFHGNYCGLNDIQLLPDTCCYNKVNTGI